ncbi:hypothetical protein C2G38_2204690 [Gigaspora rosea]|uniref:Uncharacterized protein n=1 Tax=Gigaspora rosea TaxID=44941 RepID=A0A397UQB1_9GLOM|nr:hypothetical protein C2G38_2204690 [Gigaspora rosea]
MEFTLGIQSTSFVESQNACIKRVLESSNIPLCDLEQIKKSLFYTASCSTIEEVESFTINEPSQSKDVDDEPDAINLSAKYLLDNLEQSTIEEIWKLSRVTSSRINHFIFLLINGSYSSYCTTLDFKGPTIKRCKGLQPFVNNELGETTNEVFINEMLFYGKVRGIARTAINKCVLHRDHEFVTIIKDYLSRVRIREDELVEQQETSTHTSSTLKAPHL